MNGDRADVGAAPESLPASHHCFVCGRDNPNGLRLRFEQRAGTVSTTCRLDGSYNGFTDRAHGGIVAALLDEAMGWATALANRRFTYTAELAVRYRTPVPLDAELRVEGWIERRTRRLTFAEGRLSTEDGALVLATATAKFMPVSLEESRHIARSLLYDPDDLRVVEVFE